MKITLVLCPSWGIETPHLGIALLVANLRRHGYQVQVCDFNIRVHNRDKEKGLWKSEEDVHWEDEDSLRRFIQNNDEALNSFVEEVLATGAEVIGFSVYNTTKRLSLELARRIKQRNRSKVIICGGQMCFPKPAAESIIREEFVDVVVMGEGEETIVNLMRMISDSGKPGSCSGIMYKDNGKIIDCGMATPIMDMDNLPYPDFSDFDLKLYDNPAQLPILSGRGCPYQCAFCNTKLFWIKYRSMSGDRIFQEVLHQLNKYEDVRFLTFNDHTVNANIRALSRFVELAIELKTKKGNERRNYAEFSWRGAAVIREEMDRDFINSLKLSGCIELEFGIESASDRVRRLMRKPPDDIKVIERVIRDTAEAGIGVRANFMFGFPGETEKDFLETLEFIKRNKDYFVQVHPSETFCHIDPNTYIYNHPEEFAVTNYKNNSLYWESIDGKNNYPERLRRHQIFCELASSLNISLSPGGHKILLHKQHFLDEYRFYEEDLRRKETSGEDIIVSGFRKPASESNFLERDKKTPDEKIRFHWIIHRKCNYNCPYCDFYEERAKQHNFNQCPPLEGWLQAWHRIYLKYGECDIEITGGEPFLYLNFVQLVKLLSRLHIVKVTTNMTGDIESWVREIDPGRVDMDLNFHPLFSEVDNFIRKTLLLKNAGFKCGICYLAYPPQVGSLWYYKKKFDQADINFALAAFWGKYGGKNYPAAYTEEEKEIIRPFLGDIDRITYHLNRESPKGRLCKAGHKYADIQANGKVVRCAQYSDKPFGNIMDAEFSLFAEPIPCEADLCPCNEYDNIC